MTTERESRSAFRAGGMLVGYYLVCRRKAWLSMRGVWMEQESESVAAGRLIDETSYSRRTRQVMLEAEAPDGTRLIGKIDGVRLKAGTLHEVKKGRAEEEAHVWQVRFYLWLLRRAGVTRADGEPFRGRLDYPKLRKGLDVTLSSSDERQLETIVANLRALHAQPDPPERHPRRAFCRNCAYEELCYG